MNKMHRAQILLEPGQHQKLAEIARREGASISEIVRVAVNEWLQELGDADLLHHHLEALEQVAQHRQAILNRRNGQPLEFDLSAAIGRLREERDDDLITSALS